MAPPWWTVSVEMAHYMKGRGALSHNYCVLCTSISFLIPKKKNSKKISHFLFFERNRHLPRDFSFSSPIIEQVSIAISVSFDSSSSSNSEFLAFSLGGEGFYLEHFEMPERDADEDRFSALGVRNVLNEEKVKASVMTYFVPIEIEIAVPHKYDSVMRPPIGFCVVYLDYFRVGFRLPMFPLLVSFLNHYRISLSWLVPNAITMVIAFQLFCVRNEKRVASSVLPFRAFSP